MAIHFDGTRMCVESGRPPTQVELAPDAVAKSINMQDSCVEGLELESRLSQSNDLHKLLLPRLSLGITRIVLG